MSSVLKAQIDWIPLPGGAINPGPDTCRHAGIGRVAVVQRLNQMRAIGRWMRMLTIPNQSSVAKAWQEFEPDDRMKPSSHYDRVVDVMEELVNHTLLNRAASSYLISRYSERKEAAAKLEERVGL